MREHLISKHFEISDFIKFDQFGKKIYESHIEFQNDQPSYELFGHYEYQSQFEA
jgi:hypothetical protein